jgi:hypothetical protein
MPIIEGTTSDPLLHSGAPSNGTDEVQTITYGSASASGAFVLEFEGYRTTSLAWNAAAVVVEAALRALPSIGALGCSVTLAGAPTNVYQVTFDAGNMLKRNVALISVYSSTVAEAGAALVTLTVAVGTPGVDATGIGSPKGKVLLRTDNGAQYYNTGTALAPVWTALAPVSTTSSTAELNFNDGPTAGVTVASKTAVLGANKELDEFHTAALYLGAAAGTLVTATAAEINKKVAAAGHAADGLGVLGIARFTFDPSADAAMRTEAAHDLGVTLPQYAVVIGGFFEVNTVFTSAAGTATIAIMVQGANDIQTATAVSGAPYSTTGLKAIVPKSTTPESTGIKLTAARAITATVGTQALTAGKLTGFLHYVVSAATA